MENLNQATVVYCPLCGEKELQLNVDEKTSMQCLSCGYSTSDDFEGDISSNEKLKEIDKDLKKWAVESQGQVWIPSILNLPIGLYYPIDVDGKMKWALAPMVQIPEEERKNYPIPNEKNKFYSKKYDMENEIRFDEFGKGLQTLNDILDKQKTILEDEPKKQKIKLPKLKDA